ncbi:TIGR03086 family metal-binding protein [Rhodococcus sp. X156]|uniref:TIGR03086 family metal-binding protein n=1 Tax=Rhodococcus sp. X156 TaxID=2499145 RepID=UPI000FDA9B96|nr:TIGR03086 family metal-binding protein [Rhodococcus sp. X156]
MTTSNNQNSTEKFPPGQQRTTDHADSTAKIDELARLSERVSSLLDGLPDEQWDDATPCTDWRVRDLVTHLVQGNRVFTAALRGSPGHIPDTPGYPDDERDAARLRAAFRESTNEVVTALRLPGVMDQTVSVPFGAIRGAVVVHLRVVEMLVHGWDLAQASGQPVEVSPELAEQELRFTERQLSAIPADRRPFGPPQPVAADASAFDRLLGMLGRAPV